MWCVERQRLQHRGLRCQCLEFSARRPFRDLECEVQYFVGGGARKFRTHRRSGASAEIFVDGPLCVIVAAATVPLLLAWAARLAPGRHCHSTLPFYTAIGGHWLSFLGVYILVVIYNLAAIAIFSQDDSAAPG